MKTINETIEMLMSVCNKSDAKFYKHKNLILTGENSSGKSKLIKSLVKKSLEDGNETIYYIDPQNRVIADDPNGGNTAASVRLEDLKFKEIVNHRMQRGIFTKKDEFTPGNPGSAVSFSAIKDDLSGKKHYYELFREFFDIELLKEMSESSKILQREVIRVKKGGEIQDLSSSESAKMRVLLEVDFAVNCLGARTVVIDEFDEFLSEKTSVGFITDLFSHYTSTKFILVIHALSPIISLDDIDIAIICEEYGDSIDKNLVRFIDAANITEMGQIEKIKNAMLSSSSSTSKMEAIVSYFVDFGELQKEDIIYLEKIKREELLPKEKIFYDYLVQGMKNNEA